MKIKQISIIGGIMVIIPLVVFGAPPLRGKSSTKPRDQMRKTEPAQVKYPTNNSRMDAATRAMSTALGASNASGAALRVVISRSGEIRVINNKNDKALGESGIKKILKEEIIRKNSSGDGIIDPKLIAFAENRAEIRYQNFLKNAAEYHDAASAPVIKPISAKKVNDYEFELFQKMNNVKPTSENLQKAINDADVKLNTELESPIQNKEYIQALRNHIDGLGFEKSIQEALDKATPAQKASMDRILKPAMDAFEELADLKMQRSALQGNADGISGHIKEGTYSAYDLKDVRNILERTNERIQELNREIKSIEDYTKREPVN